MNCIYNFNYTEETAVSLLVQNRAFQYGDGLFETMICHQGKVVFLENHFERLTAGMKALYMEVPEKMT